MKVIEINNCLECPYTIRFGDIHAGCVGQAKYKTIDNPLNIPNWCHLPDRHLTNQCSGQETPVITP